MPLKLSEVLSRELEGMVISKVSRQAGISVSLLHDWMVGHRVPSGRNLGKVRRLADLLGLTMDEVLFDSTLRPVSKVAHLTISGVHIRIEVVENAHRPDIRQASTPTRRPE